MCSVTRQGGALACSGTWLCTAGCRGGRGSLGEPASSRPPSQGLERLIRREDLTFSTCRDILHGLIASAEPTQLAAFLVLLRAKVGVREAWVGPHAGAGDVFAIEMQRDLPSGASDSTVAPAGPGPRWRTRLACPPTHLSPLPSPRHARRLPWPWSGAQGETAEEVAGLAQAMVELGVQVHTPHDGALVLCLDGVCVRRCQCCTGHTPSGTACPSG